MDRPTESMLEAVAREFVECGLAICPRQYWVRGISSNGNGSIVDVTVLITEEDADVKLHQSEIYALSLWVLEEAQQLRKWRCSSVGTAAAFEVVAYEHWLWLTLDNCLWNFDGWDHRRSTLEEWWRGEYSMFSELYRLYRV